MNDARSWSVLQRPLDTCAFRPRSTSIFAWYAPSRYAASACFTTSAPRNPRLETTTSPKPTHSTTTTTNADCFLICGLLFREHVVSEFSSRGGTLGPRTEAPVHVPRAKTDYDNRANALCRRHSSPGSQIA